MAERNATHLHIPSNCNPRRFVFVRLKPYCSTSVKGVFAMQHAGPDHVRFTPESGHSVEQFGCPLCANSGHCFVQKDLIPLPATHAEIAALRVLVRQLERRQRDLRVPLSSFRHGQTALKQ